MSSRVICDRCGATITAAYEDPALKTAEDVAPVTPVCGHYDVAYRDEGGPEGPRNVRRTADLCGACCVAHLAFLAGQAIQAR